MLMKSVGIYINAFIILLLDITSAKVPTYGHEFCNKVIQLGTQDQAAKLSFHYKPNLTPRVCLITIETVGLEQTTGVYYRIAYAFLHTDVHKKYECWSQIYFNNGYSTDIFCGRNVYPDTHGITRANELVITFVAEEEKEFTFDVLLLSFHNGSCRHLETRCQSLLGEFTLGAGCIEYSLVCNEEYKFCGTTGSQCSDIGSSTGSNNTIVAATVVSILAVLLLGLICFLCYRKNFFGLLKRNESEEDVRTRAMHVFSVQYANRGVDGNVNIAATDDEGNPIDFRNFDPPPEYGSWEHIDTVRGSEMHGNTEDSGDILPKYEEVMNNFDDYGILTQI